MVIMTMTMTVTAFGSSLLPSRPMTSPPARRGVACISSSHTPPPEDRKKWGRKVDEDMVMLRTRIRERRIADGEFDDHDGGMGEGGVEGKEKWMEWERKYYETSYASDVCELVGLLQNVLLRTRPGVPVGVLGLLVVGVLASATGVVVYLVHHLCVLFTLP